MPPIIFANGEFVDPGDARISAMDAGFQHAVGLFETMLGGVSPDGEPRVRLLGDHLARLEESASALRLTDMLRTEALGDAVLATVKQAGLERARVRLTITGGDLARMGGGRSDPTVLVAAQPATSYPDEMFERGVLVTIADSRANPLQPIEGHKTLSYWWRLRELQQASQKNAAEALVLQVTNHLCGGCVSNVFIVREGEMITPIARGEEGLTDPDSEAPQGVILASPVLPGITRAAVLRLAEVRGIRCTRRMVAIDDVVNADEIFLTNSSWGVLPVVQVEAKPVGSGAPGPITRMVREDINRLIDAELGGLG